MRLIDADKFEAVLICGTEGHEDTFDDGICYMLNRIDEAPTADAVEVVRCKDCKYRHSVWHKDGRMKDGGYYSHYCELDTGDPFELGRDAHIEDWYCADGERKEND